MTQGKDEAMRTTGWTVVLVGLVFWLACGCDSKDEASPATEKKAAPAAEAQAQPEAIPSDKPKKEFDVPPGLAPITCDGELALEDIPDHPVSGVIHEKYLQPNMAFVKASKFMKQVSFDFGKMKHVKEETPCFSTGLQLRASVYYKLDKVRQDKDLTIPAGTHMFSSEKGDYSFIPAGQDQPKKLSATERNKSPWRSWYVFEQSSGTPMSVNPPYYGILVLDELSVEGKPEKPFASAGRAKGRLAICFKDQSASWLAGTFDVPVCR